VELNTYPFPNQKMPIESMRHFFHTTASNPCAPGKQLHLDGVCPRSLLSFLWAHNILLKPICSLNHGFPPAKQSASFDLTFAYRLWLG